MNRLLLALLLALLALSAGAQTQIDPGFLAQRLYQPAQARAALQLSSGARLVFGAMRAEHQDVPGLAAYQPNGQLDTQFQTNLAGAVWTDIKGAVEAPGGKIWLVASRVVYGTATYFQLVRLNADGSRDTSFAPPTAGWGTINGIAAQPDGKIIVAGTNLLRPGTTAAVPALRLNADGTPDAAFNSRLAAINPFGAYASGDALLLQPDGKLLLAVSGNTSTVIRLNTDGSSDTGFQLQVFPGSPMLSTRGGAAGSLALQPDGKILIGADYSGSLFFAGLPSSSYFFRFSATGLYDSTFAPPLFLCPRRSRYMAPTVQVWPNGRILLAIDGVGSPLLPANYHYLAQLLPNGNADTSWLFPNSIYSVYSSSDNALSVQLLASGQALVAGGLVNVDSPLALPTAVHLLQPTGAVASFVAPLLQQSSNADLLALQPGGKIVVGGHFTEINGVTTGNLARLQANGTTDSGFSSRCPFTTAAPTAQVYPLFTYPDGRLLVGGNFTFQANGQQWVNLVRLLANGRLDSSFVSTAYGAGSPYGSGLSPYEGAVYGAGLQPNGKIIITGSPSSNASHSGARYLTRLTATGQLDATFQSAITSPTCVLVRADGRIVVGTAGAAGQSASVVGLQLDGGHDPSFAAVNITNGTEAPSVTQVLEAAGGQLLLRGNFTTVGTLATAKVGQLLPSGVPDPGFIAVTITPGFPRVPTIYGTAVQPNGRVLLGGIMRAGNQTTPQSLVRLLPNGALDPGFGLNVQPNGPVFDAVVQPDGAILIPGIYDAINGQQHLGLARLLDANVLHAASAQVAAATLAYPVPARDHLRLHLDAASRPQRVQLRDALGRLVLTQAVAQPDMVLNTAALPAGLYLLRVDYGQDEPVTRRVVIE